MKISVIVPVYNVQEYLSACIESIMNQTYTDLEIILVDDGSTDSSGHICDEYSKIDSRITVVHKSNGGVSAARNSGIDKATGDYITFVDSDDTIDLDMYEILINLVNEHHADIVHCGYKHIVGHETRLIHDTGEILVQNSDEALYYLIAGIKFGGSICNKLYSKKCISELRLREDIKINEDILYNYYAFRCAKTLVFADYAKYNYIARLNVSSCFTTPGKKKLYDSCIVHKEMYEGVKNTSLARIAGEQYIRALSGVYRFHMKNHEKKELRLTAKEIWSVYLNENIIGKRMKMTAILTHYCPFLYQIAYTIHDKIRKPNWEV